MIPPIPAYVYRYLNNEGEIIYVGSTIDIHKRNTEHKCTDEWFGEVAEINLIETKTRTDALALESHYIALWKPKYNKKQKDYGNLSILRIEPEWLTLEEYETVLQEQVKNEMRKADGIIRYKPLFDMG